MTLPRFNLGEDPGPSFIMLLQRSGWHTGAGADGLDSGVGIPEAGMPGMPKDAITGEVRHGTTCLAVCYTGGVLLAGDRRATSGSFISSHRIEKVFAADSHSGVAISGAAGPAVEMVRLFQLQLEHYEKVEGMPISLEGKANQLSQMVRSNMPAAVRGFLVIPIFAGFDIAGGIGRIFEYDITGGRYEERSHAAAGSGSMHAQTVLKLGMRPSQTREEAVDLALEALLVAADSDAATGGPDPLRGIFPLVASIDVDGYRRADSDELRDRTDRLLCGESRSRRSRVTGSGGKEAGRGSEADTGGTGSSRADSVSRESESTKKGGAAKKGGGAAKKGGTKKGGGAAKKGGTKKGGGAAKKGGTKGGGAAKKGEAEEGVT